MPGIAMGQRYNHLTLDERCSLRALVEMGMSKGDIARRLARHRSTIDRELRRNRCADGYRADNAARRAWARNLRGSKIARSTRLRAHVEDRLAMGWSPEQIAGRMELDGSEHAISAESIYRHAYSPAGRGAGLPRLLAQRKPKRGRRRRNGRRVPAIPTGRRSTSGRQKPIFAASSVTGRATSCTFAVSATSC
jgi:transposase, IS30 family